MKVPGRLKRVFHLSFAILFISGAVYSVTDISKSVILRVHSVSSLWFFLFFGYFYAKHIQPSLRRKKKKTSGVSTLAPFIILFLTVPVLFYATNDSLRDLTAKIHTVLGFALIAPLVWHLFLDGKKRRPYIG